MGRGRGRGRGRDGAGPMALSLSLSLPRPMGRRRNERDWATDQSDDLKLPCSAAYEKHDIIIQQGFLKKEDD
jgi:hypothetical protein